MRGNQRAFGKQFNRVVLLILLYFEEFKLVDEHLLQQGVGMGEVFGDRGAGGTRFGRSLSREYQRAPQNQPTIEVKSLKGFQVCIITHSLGAPLEFDIIFNKLVRLQQEVKEFGQVEFRHLQKGGANYFHIRFS